MSTPENYMKRCLELAEKGRGYVSPNPMVGCVIVHEDRVIGEGWHEKYGLDHAEDMAFKSVAAEDLHLIKGSTLYVNLEPCSHWGNTPPCAELISAQEVGKVVVGTMDTNNEAKGGMEVLLQNKVQVVEGIRESECRDFNRRFFTLHEKNRPYIILKWAESTDGFMAPEERAQKWISNEQARMLSHRWRSEEDAIMVGTNTAMIDNPRLTNRLGEGRQPLRVVIDRRNIIPETHHLKNGRFPTLIFNASENKKQKNIGYIPLEFDHRMEERLLAELADRKISSLIIEGGKKVLSSFIKKGLWDEARIFRSPTHFHEGIAAPVLDKEPWKELAVGDNDLIIYRN